jgi:UDP-N-acetylmuramate dehydrogenase
MLIEHNKNLKSYNTFNISACCNYFCEINSEEDFNTLIKNEYYKNSNKLIIGGGSNILFTKDFNGIVIHNQIKGISIIEENEEFAFVQAGAGENWHEFVLWTIEKGFYGLENLSLIPGCVGASPMQNIGAYGVEIKDFFLSLDALSLLNGNKSTFTNAQCKFGYRESIFKKEEKNKYLISSVKFKLNKKAHLNTTYGAINDELKLIGTTTPSAKDVSNAVIKIRQSKLPNPKELGNAGSFFKNPEVSSDLYNKILKEYPKLVAYPLNNNNYKLAAGWLIEQCDLKGYELNGAAVHIKQALVLINKNNCTGKDVLNLSDYVIQKVFNKFGVKLEREVNII